MEAFLRFVPVSLSCSFPSQLNIRIQNTEFYSILRFLGKRSNKSDNFCLQKFLTALAGLVYFHFISLSKPFFIFGIVALT